MARFGHARHSGIRMQRLYRGQRGRRRGGAAHGGSGAGARGAVLRGQWPRNVHDRRGRARRARRHVRVHPRSGIAPPCRGGRASDDRPQLRRAADVRAVRVGVGVSRGAVDADRSWAGTGDPRRGPEGPAAGRYAPLQPRLPGGDPGQPRRGTGRAWPGVRGAARGGTVRARGIGARGRGLRVASRRSGISGAVESVELMHGGPLAAGLQLVA